MSAKYLTALCVALFCFSTLAQSQTFPTSSDELYESMTHIINSVDNGNYKENTSDALQDAFVIGWMSGVKDMMAMNGQENKSLMKICPSSSVAPITMAREYVKYMDSNLKAHQMPMIGVFMIALMRAYPCH